jgi:ABC-2 type transport system ATP-binding protein
MSILVKEISKIYGTQKALDQVSFEIKSGEIVGFLGPNGAGKSTMMKILTSYIPQTYGKAYINGIATDEDDLAIKRLIGYLPESNPLYHDMYIKEYLEYVAGIYKLDKKSAKTAQMIELTGLGPEQHKKIGQLSKGYKQRVGLAQALIHDPQVLILDEPTTAFDPNQVVEIRKVIQEAGKKKTVLFSTHIMQEVEAVCSRVIIIDKGRIVADDATEKILQSHGGTQVVSVEFDRAPDENKLLSIPGITRLKHVREQVWIVEAEQGNDIRSLLFRFAVDNDLIVFTLQKEERKLEDVFRDLTKK